MKAEFDIFFTFDGNCREALKFYEEAFGLDLKAAQVISYEDIGGDAVPEEHKDKVVFAELTIFGKRVFFSDAPDFFLPQYSNTGNNILMAIALSDKAEMERLFEAFSEGGTIIYDPKETEVIELLAIIKDKFGITWQLSLRPAGSEAE